MTVAETDSSTPPSRRRRSLTAVGAVLAVAGFVVGALLVVGQAFDHWNGRTISITNNCGYDVYADDGADGLPIRAGETISSDRASQSGDKTIRLWRSSGDRSGEVDGLDVELHGDFTLAGSRCP